jgi:hypothetical protein
MVTASTRWQRCWYGKWHRKRSGMAFPDLLEQDADVVGSHHWIGFLEQMDGAVERLHRLD